MKTINYYTIYCTPEQMEKALELGAQLEYHCPSEREKVYHRPTAEQMLGWLRSKGFRFKIVEYANATYWRYHIELSFKCGKELCYKDAVLSLIDNALDYLINNKK